MKALTLRVTAQVMMKKGRIRRPRKGDLYSYRSDEYVILARAYMQHSEDTILSEENSLLNCKFEKLFTKIKDNFTHL